MLEINFGEFPVFETKRLKFTQFELSDAGHLHAIRSNPQVLTYLDRAPSENEREMVIYIQKMHQSFAQNDGITWALRLGDSPKLIGSIGIWKIDKEHHRGELGYTISPEYWRQGLISEALPKVIDYGFKVLGLHSLQANTHKDNQASQAVLKKNGFVKEAHFRENWYYNGKFTDSVIFCLLATD